MKLTKLGILFSAAVLPALIACKDTNRDRTTPGTAVEEGARDMERTTERAAGDLERGTERAAGDIERGTERAAGDLERGTERAAGDIERGVTGGERAAGERTARAQLSGFGANAQKISGTIQLTNPPGGDNTRLLVNVSGAPAGSYIVKMLNEDDCNEVAKMTTTLHEDPNMLGRITVGQDGKGQLDTNLTSSQIDNSELFNRMEKHTIVVQKAATDESAKTTGPGADTAAEAGDKGLVACGQIIVSDSTAAGG